MFKIATKRGNEISIRTTSKELEVCEFLKEHLNWLLDEEDICFNSLEIEGKSVIKAGEKCELRMQVKYFSLEEITWHIYEIEGREKSVYLRISVDSKKGFLGLLNRYRISFEKAT